MLWVSKMVLADKLSNLNPSLELTWLGKPDIMNLIPRTHVTVEGESQPHKRTL